MKGPTCLLCGKKKSEHVWTGEYVKACPGIFVGRGLTLKKIAEAYDWAIEGAPPYALPDEEEL